MCSANMGEAGCCSLSPPPASCVRAPTLLAVSLAHLAQLLRGPWPVGSQIALHCLGPQQSWKPGNLSWASRWGCLRQWRGWVTICRASLGGAMGWRGSARLPAHPWGETWAGSTGPGLLLQELREAAPGTGVALRSGWVFAGGCCPWGSACHGLGHLDSAKSRVLGELGVGVWFRPCLWKVLGQRPMVPFTHHRQECGSLAPWVGALIIESLLSLVYQVTSRKSSR